MDNFLSITTVYNDLAERNINYLSSLYCDIERLASIIRANIENSIPDRFLKGVTILVKPNWVYHSVRDSDHLCLRTNDNFLIAALRVLLSKGPSKIVIGDAPIQGCRWDRVVSNALAEEITKLSVKNDISIEILDFRRRKYIFSENSPLTSVKPLSDYVIFDMGTKSMLEPITEAGNSKFRVTNYDPDRMSSAHSKGVHKYCIAKEFFDADIVFSLPKIKTHEKTGITGALKNLVGINGDKDFLPHHRIGGIKHGGDCYPGRSFLRYWSELLLDEANRSQGSKNFWFWQKLSSLFWRMSFPGPEHSLTAGWHGNDTTWRMVTDLNRIAEYGVFNGTLSDKPQRQIFSLCDGIVGGQGDGPLEPQPMPLGVISLTNDSVINDRAMAILMGMPVGEIPLLNFILQEKKQCLIYYNGIETDLDSLKAYSQEAKPPKGWIKYLGHKL